MKKQNNNPQKKIALKRFLPFAISLMVIFLSLAAILLADQAEKSQAWRVDLSYNQVTTQSEEMTTLLKDLPHPVHAYAIFTPGQEDQALIGLLNRLSSLTPKFTYSVENLVENPLLINTLSSSLTDEPVSSDSLVLKCEATGRARVLSMADYLSQSFDMSQQRYLLNGLRYEESIAEALVFITRKNVPQVAILQGHGELGETETAYLHGLLKDHHFEVDQVDLSRGDALRPESTLLILSPQKDLLQSELDQIVAFTKKGGAILAVSDFSDPDNLPLFDSLYRSLGFIRKPGLVVADREDAAAYTDSQVYLTPYMEMTEATAPLIGAGQTSLRLPGARAFEMASGDSDLLVSPLLTSGLAYLKNVNVPNPSLLQEEGDETGQFYLGLLSDRAYPDGTHSRAVILGNSSVLTDSWLAQVSYGSQFFLQLVDYLNAEPAIRFSITPKQLIRPPLEIKNPTIPVVLLALFPLLIPAIALPLFAIRRKK